MEQIGEKMKETNTLDRASEIGKETLAKIEAEKVAKAQSKEAKVDETKKTTEEPKGASATDSSVENNKTEGIKAEVENKAEDKAIEKVEAKVEAKEVVKTPEDKIKEWQEDTQKRIDELKGELKAAKHLTAKEKEARESLEKQLAVLTIDLEQSGTVKSEVEKVEDSEESVYAKMVEDDKSLPRNKRREMSEAEIEDFLLEDYAGANQWLVKRELRRERDIEKKLKSKETEKNNQENGKVLKDKSEKFFTKFPSCYQETRHRELVTSGKSANEALDIIKSENPDFKMMMDIIQEHPEMANSNNIEALDLLTDEMDKRKSAAPKKEVKKMYTAEEVAKIQEEAAMKERDRIASIDAGIKNSAGTENRSTSSNDPIYKQGLELFVRAGKRQGKNWTEADYKATLEYGNKARKADSSR